MPRKAAAVVVQDESTPVPRSTRGRSARLASRSPGRTSKSPSRRLRGPDAEQLKKIEQEIESLKTHQAFIKKHIGLFTHPVLVLRGFFGEMSFLVARGGRYLLHHIRLFILGVILSIIAGYLIVTPGSHQPVVQKILDELWWVFLGFLSSFGLGTGLHTFVLYLGPFIAQTTMAAFACGNTKFTTLGEHAFHCLDQNPATTPAFTAIMVKVMAQSIAWGVGTAIGELPPYFVARAARLSGQELEEQEEIDQLLNEKATSLKDRMTKKALQLLQRLGFWGILMFASIPNPLFDLAGLMSGHLLMPFSTFFGATAIGKGLIKVSIQSVFVIFIFTETHLKTVLDLIQRVVAPVVPSVTKSVNDFLAAQKAKFTATGENLAGAVPKESLISRIWGYVLILMIAYFVISIVVSTARSYHLGKDEARMKELLAEKSKVDAKKKTLSDDEE